MNLSEAILESGQVRLNGELATATQESSPEAIEFIVEQSGERRVVSASELVSSYSSGKLALSLANSHRADFQPVIKTSELNPTVLKERVRLHYCQAFDRSGLSVTMKSMKQVIAEHKHSFSLPHTPPAPGTLFHWVRERGKPGERYLAAMRDRQIRGPKGPRLCPEAEQIIKLHIDAHYADLRCRKVTTRDRIWAAINQENRHRAERGARPLSQPSESTIYRRLADRATKENITQKFGRHIAKQAYTPLRGQVEASRPLERVVIDHTVLDLHLVDERTGKVWGRPTLCVMIDVHTRAILSFVLSVRAPSVETLVGLLRLAVRPKSELLARYAPGGEWPMFGLPMTLVIDNGIEGVSETFMSACLEQNIDVEVAPVRTPEYKGIVERLFRFINENISELPGGIPGSASKMRSLRFKPDEDAQLTLEQCRALMTQWIVSFYHKRPHPALDDQSPMFAWRKALEVAPLRLAPDLDQFDSSFGWLEKRHLSRKGVQIDNLVYSGPELDGLLRDLLPTVKTNEPIASSVKVDVRVMPDDMGTVHVFNTSKHRYVPLICEQLEYATDLPRDIHQEICRELRETRKQANDPIELAKAKTRWLQSAEAAAKESKRAHRRKAMRKREIDQQSGGRLSSANGPLETRRSFLSSEMNGLDLTADDFELDDWDDE